MTHKALEAENGKRAENRSLLKKTERLDDLQRGGYRIIQDPSLFLFGMDAVLLSAYAKVLPGEKVLDLGTGTGIIPILLSARTQGAHFTGLEIQERCADMARRSVRYNGIEDRVTIDLGDIREADKYYLPASFDVVTANPPYMKNNSGLQGGNDAVTIARHEILCTLEDVVRAASRMLGDRGRFYMVCRPQRLGEIFLLCDRYRMQIKNLRLVHPYADREPNMVLTEAVKGARSGLRIAPPLVVYNAPGEYTQEVLHMYND